MKKLKEVFDYYFQIISLILIITLLIGIICLILTKNQNNNTKYEGKKSNDISSSENISNNRNIKIDIKGAIKKPGVYEVTTNNNVLDLINLAGGLTKNATTDNINLSRLLEDQMVIKIYTKNEHKNSKSKDIRECICPDVNIDNCEDNPIIKKDGENINAVISNKPNEENNTSSSKNIISINNATKEELMTLNSIGEAKANAIISYRNNNGPFKDIEEIKNVTGIGEALFAKIKDFITT